VHLAAEQESRHRGRLLAELPGHDLIQADMVGMAGQFQFMQAQPGPLARERLDMRMRVDAVRAGQRPEEIELDLGLATGAGGDPDIVGMRAGGGVEQQRDGDQPASPGRAGDGRSATGG